MTTPIRYFIQHLAIAFFLIGTCPWVQAGSSEDFDKTQLSAKKRACESELTSNITAQDFAAQILMIMTLQTGHLLPLGISMPDRLLAYHLTMGHVDGSAEQTRPGLGSFTLFDTAIEAANPFRRYHPGHWFVRSSQVLQKHRFFQADLGDTARPNAFFLNMSVKAKIKMATVLFNATIDKWALIGSDENRKNAAYDFNAWTGLNLDAPLYPPLPGFEEDGARLILRNFKGFDAKNLDVFHDLASRVTAASPEAHEIKKMVISFLAMKLPEVLRLRTEEFLALKAISKHHALHSNQAGYLKNQMLGLIRDYVYGVNDSDEIPATVREVTLRPIRFEASTAKTKGVEPSAQATAPAETRNESFEQERARLELFVLELERPEKDPGELYVRAMQAIDQLVATVPALDNLNELADRVKTVADLESFHQILQDVLDQKAARATLDVQDLALAKKLAHVIAEAAERRLTASQQPRANVGANQVLQEAILQRQEMVRLTLGHSLASLADRFQIQVDWFSTVTQLQTLSWNYRRARALSQERADLGQSLVGHLNAVIGPSALGDLHE